MSDKSNLYYGKPMIFDEEKHAYTWDGKLVPGVTTILRCIDKPALIQWSAGMASDHWLSALKSGRIDHDVIHKEAKVAHRKKLKDAGNIGTNVHLYAECYFKGLPAPELKTDEAKRGVEAFHKWLDSHTIKILSSERMVLSQEHYYAGTYDFLAEIDGLLAVGDIKTGSGIYVDHHFQTAAYQQAIQEETGTKVDMRQIVRFDKKTGEFETKALHNFELDFNGFKAALGLHRALQQMKAG